MSRRFAATAILVSSLLAATAAPAAADPAGPTNYVSRVTDIEPTTDAIEVVVRGGDAFVQLTASPGTTVDVEGYEGEPYLRFLPDGTVERNDASPARWLNDARYGAAEVSVPPEASPEAPPRWEPVATGGTYAWHDHRVHWMSPAPPDVVDPAVAAPQRINPWELPITVDDTEVVVFGELDWLPPASPFPAAAVVLIVVALGVAIAVGRPDLVPLVPLVGALAAGMVGIAGSTGLPPGADADPALIVLPAVAAALTVASLAVRRRPGTGPRLVAALAGVPLLVWSILLARAFTAPVIPTALAEGVARLLVAVALGAGLACLVAAGRTVIAPPVEGR